MKATYYGHSCVEIEVEGIKILLDPFISFNPNASEIKLSEIKPDYIFLSHGHEDHVADMAGIQKESDATVVAVVETAGWVRRQGVPNEKVIEFNLGGTLNLPFGKVKMVYALHTNSTPDGLYGGVPVGFVFFLKNKTIYFAGDTALSIEMKLLRSYSLDIAFLPIGGHYTMDSTDAIIASEFINCKNIVGIHYDTFPPIQIDSNKVLSQFSSAGVNLILPAIGESISI